MCSTAYGSDTVHESCALSSQALSAAASVLFHQCILWWPLAACFPCPSLLFRGFSDAFSPGYRTTEAPENFSEKEPGLDWICPQVVEVETGEDPGPSCACRRPEIRLFVSVSLARCHVEAMAWLPFSRIQNTKLVWPLHCGLDPGIRVSTWKPC